MMILARGIKLPNVAAVQCPHDADARHHGRAVEFDDREQGFDRGLSSEVRSRHVVSTLNR